MNSIDNSVVRLLSIALKGPGKYEKYREQVNEIIKGFSQEDWNRFLTKTKAHSILSLMYDILEASEYVPESEMKIVRENARGVCRTNYRMLTMLQQITGRFNQEGIIICVLKGLATSWYFPTPELRKAADIDLLLADISREADAIKLLKGLGFSPAAKQLTNHHIEMKGPEGITLELHVMPAEPFDDARMNSYMEKLVPKCRRHVVIRKVMGVDIPMLDTAYHAYELLLHMLQHFLRSGFGLKLLCDWVELWNHFIYEEVRDYGSCPAGAMGGAADNAESPMNRNQENDNHTCADTGLKNQEYSENKTGSGDRAAVSAEDRKRISSKYLRLVNESGLKGFSDMVTAVCIRYLGLKQRRVEWMKIDKRLLAEELPGAADDVSELMKEIMEAEEFGKSSGDRMVALRGTGPVAYFREFHHQMKLNYPKAGRIFILWPVLWTATLVRFLRNNRTVRNNASVKGFMKSAGKRGRLVKKMKLFK